MYEERIYKNGTGDLGERFKKFDHYVRQKIGNLNKRRKQAANVTETENITE